MKAPGQDPQPCHMDFYVDTTGDNGGVHINSGIPNHAVFVLPVHRRICLERLNNPHATFHDWTAQTVDSAVTLHGLGWLEVNLLRRAWKLVGIQI